MSVRRLDYYDVTCDYPGCIVDTAYAGGDYSAMSAPDQAVDDWVSGDGQELRYTVLARVVPEVTWLTDAERTTTVLIHLCEEHRVYTQEEHEADQEVRTPYPKGDRTVELVEQP